MGLVLLPTLASAQQTSLCPLFQGPRPISSPPLNIFRILPSLMAPRSSMKPSSPHWVFDRGDVGVGVGAAVGRGIDRTRNGADVAGGWDGASVDGSGSGAPDGESLLATTPRQDNADDQENEELQKLTSSADR